MNTITIEEIRQRTGRPPRTRKRTYTLPESVDELTPRQMRTIARILEYGQAHDVPPTEINLIILQALLRMRTPEDLGAEQIAELMKLLDFLQPDAFVLHQPITRWVGPFKAPRRNMTRFIGHQIELCDTILQAITNAKKSDARMESEFCASYSTLLGLPWSNAVATHIGVPFFRYLVRRSTRQAMIIEYKSLRRVFPERYPNAFDAPTNTYERFPSLGWPGTVVRLAGDKFGTPDRVRRTPAHQLFAFLELSARDRMAQNRKS